MKALGPSPSTVRPGSTCGDRGHHAGAMLAWNESHVGMEKKLSSIAASRAALWVNATGADVQYLPSLGTGIAKVHAFGTKIEGNPLSVSREATIERDALLPALIPPTVTRAAQGGIDAPESHEFEQSTTSNGQDEAQTHQR